MMIPDLSEARRLFDAGFHLVPLERYTKKPPEGIPGWNKPENRAKGIESDATGYGFPLSSNQLCSIDPDNWPLALRGMAALGFDLEALMVAGVRTKSTRTGSGGRSTFREEPDLSWLKFASRDPSIGTVLELRADSANLQDVVPGLVYFDKAGTLCTQQYANCKRLDDAPGIPDAFLAWWQRCSIDIDFLREQQDIFMRAIGATANLAISTGRGSVKKLAFEAPGYRGWYNATHSVERLLDLHGYEWHAKLARWSCPTASGAPGIRLIPGKTDLWQSDHASDPLSGTFDAWIANVVLNHFGNLDSAIKAVDRERISNPSPLADAIAIEGGDEAPTLKLREQRTINIDSRLLRPPGVLGVMTDHINATSKKPQPQFAVQTAIATACTMLGRRFVTNFDNWPSLYLLNVGKSSSGKEWAKTASEALLEACGLDYLIGPSGYTSASGVLSSLLDQPNHLTVVDEFHRELEKASVKGNAHALGAIKTLMEVWGRNSGALRPQGHSTLGQRKMDKEKASERTVRNPALTMLAMTIPDFFETIGSAAARDGFLNRFLIVESDVGRQPSSLSPSKDVPQPIVDWATEIRARYTGLICPDTNALSSPSPVVVPITDPAMAIYRAFEVECLGYMDHYEKDGLAEMFGRTNEMAMRLGLVIALGRGDTVVKPDDAEWACLYCKTYALRTVERLVSSMADSEFEAAKNQVVTCLVEAHKRGLTVRELNRVSRKFRALDQRQQVNLLNSLAFVGQAQHVTFPSPSGRGQPRNAWVALDDSQVEGDGDE